MISIIIVAVTAIVEIAIIAIVYIMGYVTESGTGTSNKENGRKDNSEITMYQANSLLSQLDRI